MLFQQDITLTNRNSFVPTWQLGLQVSTLFKPCQCIRVCLVQEDKQPFPLYPLLARHVHEKEISIKLCITSFVSLMNNVQGRLCLSLYESSPWPKNCPTILTSQLLDRSKPNQHAHSYGLLLYWLDVRWGMSA